MVDLVGIALVLSGVVLLLAGAALSVYGVAILGVLAGGGAGFVLAPTIGPAIGLEGVLAVPAATALGVIVGVVASYLLLSTAVAALSFLAGTYAGLVVVAPLLGDGAAVLVSPIALVVGGVAAFVGTIMTRTVLVLVTSFVGATLASGSLTVADVAAAGEQLALDPLLYDVASPIFLGLFALGVLVQFGLFQFGYVTKLVAALPGASVIHDRGEDTTGQ